LKQQDISFFEKNLTLWVLICMVIGVLIGRFIPIVPNALGKLEFYNVSIPTTILLWIMIYPMMLKIDFKSIKNPKGLFITWFVVLEQACVRNWHNMELMYMMDWLSIILLGYPLTLLFQWKCILI